MFLKIIIISILSIVLLHILIFQKRSNDLPNKKEIYSKNIFSIFILLTSYISIAGYLDRGLGFPLSNTFLLWTIEASFLIFILIQLKWYSSKEQAKSLFLVTFFILYNVFCIIRGIFIAETYWDFKGLTMNGLALLVPLITYIATNTKLLSYSIHQFLKKGIGLFFLIMWFIPADSYGMYLAPLSLLLVFVSAIPQKSKLYILGLVFFIILSDFGARSNVIKLVIPLLLGLLYYIKNFLPQRLLTSTRIILIIIPIVLFVLGIKGIFNVFEMDSYIKKDITSIRKSGKEENLLADTRTFIYAEVLYTAKVYNSWWIGRTPARGNLSDWFGEYDENDRGERLRNEVGIVNTFTWTGIVGVILLFLVFYHASYLGLYRSNNFYLKLIALFVSFRWAYSWVEDINMFNSNYLFLWIMIGMCYSKTFRDMSDEEFKEWIRSIFSKPLKPR